jgi:thiosulfate reductase cytochrome b subunit
VRFVHWTNAVAISVLVTSGLQKTLIDIPAALALGGWLGGALQWHFTFTWIFAGGGLLYAISQFASGHYRVVLFIPRDVPGVWPMARYYFLFGPKPAARGPYNPLQKLACTSAIAFGALSLLTGMVMFKPAQFSALALLFGGCHNARVIHFLSMWHPVVHSPPPDYGGAARLG